jgi:DNA invertase Pin-like site-specific DNA recombinase
MRVAIYARKSSESEDRQVQSLDDQLNLMYQLAAREGLLVVEVYQESRSAKAPGTREEFAKLLADIHKGHIQGIVTWSMNRLSRNPVDGGQVAYLLQTGKLEAIYTHDRKYLPEDNALLLSIENGMATAYIQELRKAVTRGMTSKAGRGWMPSKAPVGYVNNILTRRIDIDPERFGVVRQAWDMLLSGESVSHIHRTMIASGLTVASRYSEPKPISKTGLFGLFGNPFYKGLMRYGGQTLPGAHEPMVTEAEWERAQDIVSNLSKPKARGSKALPFAREIVCAKCGCAVVGERKLKYYPSTRRMSEYIYYHCSGARGCPKASLTERELKAQLLGHAERATLAPDVSSWLLASFRQYQQSAAFQHEKIVQLGSELAEQGANLAEQLKNVSNLKAITEAVKKLGKLTLEGQVLKLELHPAYEKMVSFEPLRTSSGSRIQTTFPLLSAGWWSIMDDLLSLLEVASTQSADTSTQSSLARPSAWAKRARRTVADEYERAIINAQRRLTH